MAAVDEVRQWWSGGIGSPVLHALIPALLAARVTVLDVGRVDWGRSCGCWTANTPTCAHWSSACGWAPSSSPHGPPRSADDPAELFARLVELAGPYRLRPLITVVPGTPVDTWSGPAR